MLLAEDEKKGPSLGFILGRFSEHALVGLHQAISQEMGSSLLLAEDEKKGPSLGFILGKLTAHALVGLL